ncbi:MAG: aminotransferase class V-fold PLP-dependent enzyme [Gammaproteobacteria bacterium]|nr:MAG: aminotransferase class V-fold PLP-dependent enzyme [Gammaproteobacteria bacterium]
MAIEELKFKIANTCSEMDAIHGLNYRTFVEEIPQHQDNPQQKLIDKFHDENTYIICMKGKDIAGMLALRDSRPFSLDAKLENLDSYLPAYRSICEIRLLAVEKKYRNTAIFIGLLNKAFDFAMQQAYDLCVISGTTRQIKLYKHIGLKQFGPLVGTENARYQPMYISIKDAMAFRDRSHAMNINSKTMSTLINCLPGPVSLSEGVVSAFVSEPVSHRSECFIERFNEVREKLCHLTSARKVNIMTGSGTLANDVVASQLSSLKGKGLILVNGEFGNRLVEHASRAGLVYDLLQTPGGKSYKRNELEKQMQEQGAYSWLWCVHCETSTGVINDAGLLKDVCQRHKIKLCLDCISTVGSCEVDLNDVYLASATSGKGIGSLPGLAMIFSDHCATSCNKQLPRYFDLSLYEGNQGIPFTISSNAVYALEAALIQTNWPERFRLVENLSRQLYCQLDLLGLQILADPEHRALHVTSILLPDGVSSLEFGDFLASQGIFLSYRSQYLISQNCVQICFMGNLLLDYKNLYEALQHALVQIRKSAA